MRASLAAIWLTCLSLTPGWLLFLGGNAWGAPLMAGCYVVTTFAIVATADA